MCTKKEKTKHMYRPLCSVVVSAAGIKGDAARIQTLISFLINALCIIDACLMIARVCAIAMHFNCAVLHTKKNKIKKCVHRRCFYFEVHDRKSSSPFAHEHLESTGARSAKKRRWEEVREGGRSVAGEPVHARLLFFFLFFLLREADALQALDGAHLSGKCPPRRSRLISAMQLDLIRTKMEDAMTPDCSSPRRILMAA